MPLNERSPIIRRQSVSRPELWPHQQVDDRDHVRDFTRCSTRRIPEHLLPSLDELQQPSMQQEPKEDPPARVASFRTAPQDPSSATLPVPEAGASKTPLKKQPRTKKNGVNGVKKPMNGIIKLKKSSSSEKSTAVKSTNSTRITR
jgi:hypothetical protein